MNSLERRDQQILYNLVDNKDKNFANARAIRNLFERIVTKQVLGPG